MVDYVSYGGCKIYVRPLQEVGPNRWKARVLIQRWGESRRRQFIDDRTFPTPTDAILPAIQFGKRIVDGTDAGHRLEDAG